RSLVPSFLAALAEAADGAVMGDGKYPCRSRRPSLIPAGTAPDLQKHFVGELFCNCGVLHESQDESEYTQLMACKYGAQSSHVSGGNSFYQRRLVSGPSHAESPSDAITGFVAALRTQVHRDRWILRHAAPVREPGGCGQLMCAWSASALVTGSGQAGFLYGD